jgi:hypothetical protein
MKEGNFFCFFLFCSYEIHRTGINVFFCGKNLPKMQKKGLAKALLEKMD